MTDYNEKLRELIKEAADHGYTFGSDNKFHEEPEYVHVMEMFWIWNSVYEETGEYYIYKRTFKITNEEYSRIMLEVNENNIQAIKLYNKLGFKEISLRDRYYGEDTAIIMEKVK